MKGCSPRLRTTGLDGHWNAEHISYLLNASNSKFEQPVHFSHINVLSNGQKN